MENTNPPQTQVTERIQQSLTREGNNPPQRQSLKKFMLIVLAVVLLLSLLIVALFALRNPFGQEQNAVTSTPTPVPTKGVEPVNEWQTYTVGEMSIKHPSYWELDRPEEGLFITLRESRPSKETLNPGKGWLEVVRSEKSIEELAPRGGIDRQEDIVLAGKNGVRFEGSNTGIADSVYYIQVFLIHNNEIYKIYIFSQDTSIKDELLSEFEQILSTVSFSG